MKRIALFTTVLFGLLLLSAQALAWDSSSLWYDPAEGAKGTPYNTMPGGGGILGTGGQGDYTITCANCHIKGGDGYGSIGLTVTPPPPSMYKPATKYDFTVKMTGEHRGLSGCSPYVIGNVNQFALTFEDASGKQVGSFTTDYASSSSCPTKPPDAKFTGSTYMYQNCRAVISTPVAGRSSWTFSWTAPAAGTGAITAYWGAVDGDCMMDSKMDDVVVGNASMGEGTASYRPPPKPGLPGSSYAWSFAFAPLVGAIVAWRRKRT